MNKLLVEQGQDTYILSTSTAKGSTPNNPTLHPSKNHEQRCTHLKGQQHNLPAVSKGTVWLLTPFTNASSHAQPPKLQGRSL